MLTKEKCIEAVNSLVSNNKDLGELFINLFILVQLIEEHFDNPPLKFEELKKDMWVWDNICKEYVRCYPNTSCCGEKCVCYWGEHRDGDFVSLGNLIFEENRFYRKQVEE